MARKVWTEAMHSSRKDFRSRPQFFGMVRPSEKSITDIRPSTTHKLHNTISYDILTFVHLCSVPTYLAYRDHQMSRLFKLLH